MSGEGSQGLSDVDISEALLRARQVNNFFRTSFHSSKINFHACSWLQKRVQEHRIATGLVELGSARTKKTITEVRSADYVRYFIKLSCRECR